MTFEKRTTICYDPEKISLEDFLNSEEFKIKRDIRVKEIETYWENIRIQNRRHEIFMVELNNGDHDNKIISLYLNENYSIKKLCVEYQCSYKKILSILKNSPEAMIKKEKYCFSNQMERNEEIINLNIIEGKTLRSIAKKFNLSNERVRQIVCKHIIRERKKL